MADWHLRRVLAAADGADVATIDADFREARRASDSNGRSVRLVELRQTGDSQTGERVNVPTYKVVLKLD